MRLLFILFMYTLKESSNTARRVKIFFPFSLNLCINIRINACIVYFLSIISIFNACLHLIILKIHLFDFECDNLLSRLKNSKTIYLILFYYSQNSKMTVYNYFGQHTVCCTSKTVQLKFCVNMRSNH